MNTAISRDAEKSLAAYLDKVDQLLAALPRQERADIRHEIQTHIDDAMADVDAGSDSQRVQHALQRLGDPADFVPELAEEMRLSRKASRGHPMAIAAAVASNLGRGALNTLFFSALGLGYLFCMGLIAIALYSLIDPNAGLWLNHGGGWTLSFERQAGADQLWSGWFWLIGSLGAGTLYATLTMVLRLWLSRPAAALLARPFKVDR